MAAKCNGGGFTADSSSLSVGREADSLLRRLRNIRHPYLKVAHLPVIALCICRFSRSRGVSIKTLYPFDSKLYGFTSVHARRHDHL